MCTYTLRQLLMLGVLMFCCRVGSRRKLKRASATPEFLDNWCRLSGARTDAVAHPDTMMYLLERLNAHTLATVPAHMVRHLIRTKRLGESFLDGHLMVTIDATGIFSSNERHCPHCLTQRRDDGSVTYMHHMLEAKVVSRRGMALSLLSEPIDNPKGGAYDKQDCELKAFKRLAPRLKELFPRQRIVLLVDAEYAGAPFFAICQRNGWRFICTFKRGSIPTLFDEAMTLLKLQPENTLSCTHDGVSETWRWLDQLPYQQGKHEFTLGFFDYRQSDPDQQRYFAWLTNFTPTDRTVKSLTKGGRLRWKTENEGFNQQKNGYSMEHFCDCSNINALTNLYLLLQIAHMLMQLLARSTLATEHETLAFLAYLLLESLRNAALPEYLFAPAPPRIQIRFAPP
jgi:hypothetical protein